MSTLKKTVDENGITVGSTLSEKRTVEKEFVLSRRSACWPTDKDGKPVELRFKVVIDLAGVEFQEILDDAIRTKIITLQNALRGTAKNLTPFEVLKTMSKETLRRTYGGCGITVDNPEKQANDMERAFASMPKEVRAALLAKLNAQTALKG